MNPMTRRPVLALAGLAALGACALVAGERHASAQAAAVSLPVEIVAMYGAQSAHPFIDPTLAGFSDRLTKPPLSSFNSYTRLEDIRLVAPFGQSVERPLPGGETLNLLVRPKPDAPGRFTLHAEIKGASAPKVLDFTVPEKKAVFVGGQHYKEGNMVLAFTLNP